MPRYPMHGPIQDIHETAGEKGQVVFPVAVEVAHLDTANIRMAVRIVQDAVRSGASIPVYRQLVGKVILAPKELVLPKQVHIPGILAIPLIDETKYVFFPVSIEVAEKDIVPLSPVSNLVAEYCDAIL